MIEILRFEIVVSFVLQIENRNGGLVYVVDFKERMIDATPVDVATAIYKQMKGYILGITIYFALELLILKFTPMHTHSIIYIKYSTNHNLFLNLQKLLIVMVMGTFTTRCLQCLHSFLKNKGKFSGMR